MTAFNYSTGNPANLIAGGGASMTDIQGSLNDVRTFLNSGTIDETNVPNLSAAFTYWKTIVWGSGLLTATAASTYFMPTGPTASVQTLAGGVPAGWAFYINPADWLANSRTTKLRVRWTLNINAVAQTGSMTAGLYPITLPFGGSSAQAPLVATVGTVVAGSTVSFVTPGANSYTVTESSEFNAPSAGVYIFGVGTTTLAASSQHILTGHLQMRQV